MKEATETILRQWNMLRLIPRHPGSIGTRELKGRLEDEDFRVDIRTIQRDLGKLSVVFPLTSVEQGKAKRWFWMEGAKVMDIPGMEPTAALAFRLAEEYLGPLLPQATLRHLAPHFQRAKEVLKPTRGNRLSLWPDKVCRISRGPDLSPPKIRSEVQDTVYRALLDDRQIDITYKRKNAEQPKSYPVNPLGVVFLEGTVYLVCTVKEYGDVRQLAMHRMSAARLLDTPCRRPDGFALHAYAKEQQEFAYPVSRRPIRLRAMFGGKAATLFAERQLSKQQRVSVQKDGRVLLQATVLDTLELRWWLRGFGDRVEILNPKALREEFKVIAQRMTRMYEG